MGKVLEVTHIEPYTRNSKGLWLSGLSRFNDDKEWKWIRIPDGFVFEIDSGVASQWGFNNYGRFVRYPKRIYALKARLSKEGQLYG